MTTQREDPRMVAAIHFPDLGETIRCEPPAPWAEVRALLREVFGEPAGAGQ